MSGRQRGFGLLEALLGLALGLMLLAAASQLFASVLQAWRVQDASARLADDARLVLQRLAQDIRMTGLAGCLRLDSIEYEAASARQALAQPLRIDRASDGTLSSLTLVLAELPGLAGPPDWTLLTDCRSWARVVAGQRAAPPGALAFPLRRHVYQLRDGTLRLASGGGIQPLIDHVQALRVEAQAVGDQLRLDLRLILFEAATGVEQQHHLSVAMRNRWPDA
ncbi:prepilin-type N-terminal cleavage/methylation domain-containing protein [Pseudomonas sp. Marseille-QA0332]